MEIVINKEYGGFKLSLIAIEKYLKLKGKEAHFYKMEFINGKRTYRKTNKEEVIFLYCFTKNFGKKFKDEDISNEEWDKYSFDSSDVARNDKDLVNVVKELGEKANTRFSSLKVIQIPNNVEWIIEEYDGLEWVAEKHKTWG